MNDNSLNPKDTPTEERNAKLARLVAQQLAIESLERRLAALRMSAEMSKEDEPSQKSARITVRNASQQ